MAVFYEKHAELIIFMQKNGIGKGDRSTFLEQFSRSPIRTGQEDSKGFIRTYP